MELRVIVRLGELVVPEIEVRGMWRDVNNYKRRIMKLGSDKGNVVYYHSCVRASYSHGLIVYEDRQEYLSFMRARDHPSTPIEDTRNPGPADPSPIRL